MAFSGVRSSWLILARKAVLEALAVSASKRLRSASSRVSSSSRARSSTLKRRRASSPMRSTSGRPVCHIWKRDEAAPARPITMSVTESPSRKRTATISDSGTRLATIHVHVAAARHHQAGDHRHDAGGQEHVVQGVAGFPAQPGQQAPGDAAEGLHHDKALQPGIGIAFVVVVVLVGGRHQGGWRPSPRSPPAARTGSWRN